ncbi:MAG: hypothetical protein DRG63_03825 [Deltaproteobacteria bacterium]|nr:MAG: hypothetical protein DRG63_03825 [Deltaproteobacteria bacterium]
MGNNKKVALVLAIAFATWLTLPAMAFAQNYIQVLKFGKIDWTNLIVEAVGEACFPPVTDSEAQARSVAKKAAVAAARANLLKLIKNIPVDSRSKVGDWTEASEGKLKRLLWSDKGAEIVNIAFSDQKEVRVIVAVKLSADLGEILLPPSIRKISPIVQPSSPPMKKNKEHTGLILDCRGIGFRPCLIPRIVDEHGEEVFGPVYVSREYVVRKGMVKYVKPPDSRIRKLWLGQRPLTLKALRVLKDRPTVVMVTNADAEKIRSDPRNVRLFQKCRVVFLVD